MRTSWGAEVIGHSYPEQFTRMKRWRKFDTKAFLTKARMWLALAKNAGKIKVLPEQCPCGKNHHSIQIADKILCPVRFWLGAAALYDEQGARLFIEKHPFDEIVVRFNKELDACYDPNLDWRANEDRCKTSPAVD